MENAKTNKAQGMYPTPIALVKRSTQLSFSKSELKKDYCLVEPGAGTGNYIIGFWEHTLSILGRKSVEKIVKNTICYENHEKTFSLLKDNTNMWLKENGIRNRPTLLKKNFLVAAHSTIDKNKTVYVVGNPPWDEYTTRKHDDINAAGVKEIREERGKEHAQFKDLGHKNVYQSFIHTILSLPNKYLTLSFVLPRQVLGDKSSTQLRAFMLDNGITKINSFKNRDYPEYEFECVDKNFEIVLLTFKRGKTDKKGNLFVCRGLTDDYYRIEANGEDLTIPCPHSNQEMTMAADLLSKHSFDSWIERFGIHISMGKVKHYDTSYNSALSGKTISPYKVFSSKQHKLVLNKILPNSDRKIKAALVPVGSNVNESLVEISCEDQEVLYYLYFMLNSKAIDSTLRSLVSNINLNIFRLCSLPIPEPDSLVLKQSRKLVQKIQGHELDPNDGSRKITEKVFKLRPSKLEILDQLYSDHNYGSKVKEKAA